MMRYITHLGGVVGTVAPALLLFALGGDERVIGFAVLVANGSSNLIVQALKRVVARPRPCDANGQPLALVPLPDPFSFPSGHAAAVTAVATTLTLAHGWLAPFVFPLAAVIATSRVTLRVHHVGDVLAGALLGLGGAALAAPLLP
jgi:undecaprenyl-diphosphatase